MRSESCCRECVAGMAFCVAVVCQGSDFQSKPGHVMWFTWSESVFVIIINKCSWLSFSSSYNPLIVDLVLHGCMMLVIHL